MKTITRLALIDLLASITRPQPIGIVALTDADALKTGNPFAQVWKLSKVNPFTGTDYGRAVNAQLTREGGEADFVPVSPRYTRISPALVQFSNGNFAVPVQFNSHLKQASSPRFFVRRSLLSPLRPVSREVVAPFLKEAKPSARQEAAGVEKPIVWRTYGIASILRVAIGGETYRVRA